MSEPVPYNYELFQHFFDEYGLILLDSEMDEIHRICQRVYEKRDDSMPKELRQIKRKRPCLKSDDSVVLRASGTH